MVSGSTPRERDFYNGVDQPSLEDLQVHLQDLVQQGAITPEQAQAAAADPSAMGAIATDPKYKQAQMDALTQLQDIGSSGGLTGADKVNLSKIQTDEDTAAKGKREAILQNAASRGLGGSGLELMSQMQNQQDSATRQSQRDMGVAAQAQQRALDAIIQGGQLGGQLQSQDFNQQAQKAQAQDAISKFNAQNQQAANMYNTQAANDAQTKNLAAKQAVAENNQQIHNTQAAQNTNAYQQQFNNAMQVAGGHQGVTQYNTTNEGKNSQAAADAQNKNASIFASAAGAFMSDARQKENIEKFSAGDFLDSLTGYKYKYKEPKKFGEGEHVGVMAQDLEKTPMGAKMVTETPDGKVVEYAKSGPAMMASLADLHERLKKMEGGEK